MKLILLLPSLLWSFACLAQAYKSDILTKQELIKLNQAYIKVLKEQRSKAAGADLVVKFDTTTMYTAHAFSYQLEKEGRIGHPPANIIQRYGVGEICQGLSSIAQKYYRERNFNALARYAYEMFSNSPGHAKVQRSSKYFYIGVGCNIHAFVVRLRESPMPKEFLEFDKQILNKLNF